MKHEKTIAVIKKIGAGFCAALTVLSTVACLLLFFFQGTLMNEDFYLSACDEQYLGQLEGYIVEHLSGELARYEESEEMQEHLARQCVDMQTVQECTKEYLIGLSRAFLQGETLEKVQYPVEKFEPFRQHVLSAAQEGGYEVDEQTLSELLSDLSKLVTSDVNSFNFNLVGMSSLSIIRLAHSKVFGNETLMAPLRISPWIPLALIVLSCTGVVCLTGGKDYLRKAYNAVTFFWVGATVLFFPVLLFRVYDLPARLAITPSPVKSLLDSLLYRLIDGLFLPVAVCFGVATVGLAVLIALQMRQYAKTLKEPAAPAPQEVGALWLEEGEQTAEEGKEETQEKEESSSEETKE